MSDNGFFRTDHANVGVAVKQMAANTGLLYYHITKAAIDRLGNGAKDAIARGVYNYGYDRGRKIAEKVLAAGEELTIENLDKYYDLPIEQGFDPHTTYKDGCRDNTIDSCVYADVWKAHGWDEIGHLYCIQHCAVRAGYNPNIQIRPVCNLLLGDDCCKSLTVYLDKKTKAE